MKPAELVAPAGSLAKLEYAWAYGADAAYIGLKDFSLRAKAENFSREDAANVRKLKDGRAASGRPAKLYCALNISFHNDDIKSLMAQVPCIKEYPFDAFIVQDLGAADVAREFFPDAALHLSTQANCINARAAKAFKRLGFSRIVLGREVSLDEIKEIKDAVPDIEIECFVHGAMCIAYSGRCLLSAFLCGRSSNSGLCAHPCRWEWKLYAEERERPGELFPVEEGDGYTAIFSSRDLCMIGHLEELAECGVDAFKIEGRMKSLYYTAVTVQAYRKKIDSLRGLVPAEEAAAFADELFNAPHREFTTGFYFSKDEASKTAPGKSSSPYKIAGTIGKEISFMKEENPSESAGRDVAGEGRAFRYFEFFPLNKIVAGEPMDYIGPDTSAIEADDGYVFLDKDTGEEMAWTDHSKPCVLRTSMPIAERFIARIASC